MCGSVRRGQAVVLLGFCLGWAGACSTDGSDPAGPDPFPEPDLPATLEVQLNVNGTRPDPDGYVVVVNLAPPAAPLNARVASTGGSVQFPNLPRGDYIVHLEDLADPCTVRIPHPRPVTLASGAQVRTTFIIDCPGPGSVRIQVDTRGRDFSTTDYTVAFEAATTSEHPIGVNAVLVLTADDLEPAGQWRVRLNGVPNNCHVSTNNPVVLTGLPPGTTARLRFSVLCIQRDTRIAFEAGGGDVALFTGAETITLATGSAFNPALSPDGRRIVFSFLHDDVGSDLFVFDVETGVVTQLTFDGGAHTLGSQAWSPDGSRVVYSRGDGSGCCSIRTIRADGTGIVQLTDDTAFNTAPAWSPDGASIAFCSNREDGFFDLYRMTTTGANVVKIIDEACEAVWSPDGTRLAVAEPFDFETPGQISVVNSDGAGRIVMSSPGFGFLGSPSWAPDGSEIAFANFSDGAIWIVGFDGTGFGQPLRILVGSSPSWR